MTIDNLYLEDTNIRESCGFWLKWRTLSAPKAKERYISIPGANGAIDRTEALGEVFYEDRTLNIDMVHPESDWYSDYQELVSEYHGRKVKIAFSNDSDWYWMGRLSVGKYTAESHELTMTAQVYPYKFAVQENTYTATVDGATEATATELELDGSRMKTVPQVVVTTGSNVTLKWGDKTATLASGTYYVDGLTVGNAGLTVSVWGTGTVNITYRRGTL